MTAVKYTTEAEIVERSELFVAVAATASAIAASAIPSANVPNKRLAHSSSASAAAESNMGKSRLAPKIAAIVAPQNAPVNADETMKYSAYPNI